MVLQTFKYIFNFHVYTDVVLDVEVKILFAAMH